MGKKCHIMIKIKTISKKMGSESGALLMASTMGIFILLSLFAFYLSRMVILESRNSGFHALDIKTRNLSLTAMEHGLQSFKASRNPETIQGSFNRGTYTVVFDSLKTESQTNLPYSHYTTMKSIAKINDVERNTRVILSTYPEAFCFSYYGNNAGSATFSETLGSITGDMFFNGDVNTSIVSSGIIYNPTGSGGTQLASPPIFPTLNTSFYDSLLTVASNQTESLTNTTNYALSFDGTNDYVAIQNLHYNNPGQIPNLTVSAWVKVPLDGGGWSIVDFDRSEYFTCAAGENYGSINSEGNLVGFHTRGISGVINDMWSVSSIRDNEWHHIVWVFDSGEVYDKKIYIDGQLDAQQDAYSTNSNLGSGAIRYGFLGEGSEANSYNASRNNAYYQGSIDQVSIWHHSFSANEISSLETISDYSATNLIAYWSMDNGTGTTIVDETGHGYNGTLINGPTWVDGPTTSSGISSGSTINLSSYTNNEFLNNGDLTLSNVTVNGPGVFVVYGNLTLESNTIINKNIKIICSGNLTVSDSQLGTDLNSAVVIYSNGIATYTNSTIYGLSISNGSSITLNNTTFYGGILNYSSTFALQGSTQITGSVVSNYSLDFQGGSISVSKGSLPPFFRVDIGLNSIVVPGSYLEY